MSKNPYGSLFSILAQQRDELTEDRCVELYNLYFHPLTQTGHQRSTIDFYRVKAEMYTSALSADILTVLIRLFRNRSVRNADRRLIDKPFMISWHDSGRGNLGPAVRQREVQQMVNFVNLLLYAYYWRMSDMFRPLRLWNGTSNDIEVQQLMGLLVDRMRDRYQQLLPFFVTTDVLAANGHLQYLDMDFVFTQYGVQVTGERQLVIDRTSSGLTKELEIFLPAPNASYPIELFDAHR